MSPERDREEEERERVAVTEPSMVLVRHFFSQIHEISYIPCALNVDVLTNHRFQIPFRNHGHCILQREQHPYMYGDALVHMLVMASMGGTVQD